MSCAHTNATTTTTTLHTCCKPARDTPISDLSSDACASSVRAHMTSMHTQYKQKSTHFTKQNNTTHLARALRRRCCCHPTAARAHAHSVSHARITLHVRTRAHLVHRHSWPNLQANSETHVQSSYTHQAPRHQHLLERVQAVRECAHTRSVVRRHTPHHFGDHLRAHTRTHRQQTLCAIDRAATSRAVSVGVHGNTSLSPSDE
jgi:hypothetical protein